MATPSTTVNAEFNTYQGDDAAPIFTVLDADGNAVNISTATAITWFCRETESDANALALSLAGGQIALVDGGAGGKFVVNISAANTALLAGFYLHGATVTLAGKVTTVIVGRMMCGLKPAWTYNPAKLDSTPLFQVRRLLGDVIFNDQQMNDSEILFALDQRANNIYGAAADCARYMAAQYSRKVNVSTPGGIATDFSEQAKAYSTLALQMERQAALRGSAMPYAGGISVRDKTMVQDDSDRVQPSFNIGMQDALLPVRQVGNETPLLPPPAGNP